MNRIEEKFRQLTRRGKKAFLAYLTAGDPNLSATERLILALDGGAGVDVIEIGVPFSDPLADGKTIQAASQRALLKHVTLDNIFALVKRVRGRSEVPIALMTYYNPVFHYGEARFLAKAKLAGVDGVIIPDLPPEEASSFRREARKNNIVTVFFLAPTTTTERMKKIVKASSGFIYYVSVTGITGTSQAIGFDAIKKHIGTAKRLTKQPICVGFGISTPEQVRRIAGVADGVIVGSEIIRQIQANKNSPQMVARVTRAVARLTKVLK